MGRKPNHTFARCPVCAKEFGFCPSQAKVYCSRGCHLRAQEEVRETARCATCDREFTYRPKRPQKYCSPACFRETVVGKPRGKAETLPERNCEHCGLTFTPRRESSGRFCSQECHLGSCRVTAICGSCGREYTAPRSQAGKHCSRECQRAAEAAANRRSCQNCGKTFRARKSLNTRFCSVQCSAAAQTTRARRVCVQCGNSFAAIPASLARFCSSPCGYEWRSEHQCGANHPLFGREMGRAKHLPPPTVKQCVMCGDAFVIKPHALDTRLHCSRACYAAYQRAYRTGENAYNWRGGSPKVYYGPSWHAAKRAARERDKVCTDCGKSAAENGRALCVHHIEPFRLFGVDRHAEANALTNLACHCSSCHLKREWRENAHTWPRRWKKKESAPSKT